MSLTLGVGLKYLALGIVSAKILVVTVGYAVYAVAAPAGEGQRDMFLNHTKGLLNKTIRLTDADRVSLQEDVSLLEHTAPFGWSKPYELAAFTRVFGFAANQDARSTLEACGTLCNEVGDALCAALFPAPPRESAG
mgnify:CR=1 FL=1